jgi:hypothetical protein
VTISHIPLILLVPWTNRDYPGIALLPLALPDFVIIYGVFKLVEKMASSISRKSGTV